MREQGQVGLTLIELLVVIVLMSILTIPLITMFGDIYQRTVHQGNDNQLLFYAQEVMEEILNDSNLAATQLFYDQGECSLEDGCVSVLTPDESDHYTYWVEVRANEYEVVSNELGNTDNAAFYDIYVEVRPPHNSSGRDKPVDIMSVVPGG